MAIAVIVNLARAVPRTARPSRVQRSVIVFWRWPMFGEIEIAQRSAPCVSTVETGPGPTEPDCSAPRATPAAAGASDDSASATVTRRTTPAW
jgi:hypothetical protein